MIRNLFKPYTKAEVVQILRRYFTLTASEAEKDAERLGACVVRDNLDAVKYIRKWEAQVRAGKRGNIKELFSLYPANNPFMVKQFEKKPAVKTPLQRPLQMPVEEQLVNSMLSGAYMRGARFDSVFWKSDTAGVVRNLRIQCVLEDNRTTVIVFWSDVSFTRYKDVGDWCIDFDDDSKLTDFMECHSEIRPTWEQSWGKLMTELTRD